MFLMRQPSDAQVRHILESQGRDGFSYPEVGATAHTLPAGYQVHHERFELGRGAPAFERAKRAVREWRMFDMGWLRLFWPDQPIVAGTTVGVLARHFGFWSLNLCRIVYAIDEQRAFGFAYGTLTEHAESGEERFLVKWREDDSVWYDLLAMSRERHLLARLGYPLSRALQAKFRRDSGAAMQGAAPPREARNYELS